LSQAGLSEFPKRVGSAVFMRLEWPRDAAESTRAGHARILRKSQLTIFRGVTHLACGRGVRSSEPGIGLCLLLVHSELLDRGSRAAARQAPQCAGGSENAGRLGPVKLVPSEHDLAAQL
jgi:hypothetical protein